ncbi:MAG: hypothetical protein KatS3mg105_3697 [Gemmatales bacterium]|nr:MAG: hypothetical protein KatS3mg105_3697 [Gemmatales bacterium]
MAIAIEARRATISAVMQGSRVMEISIQYGKKSTTFVVRRESLIPIQRAKIAEPLTDVTEAVRSALEQPIGFPPLRQALTPDDRVAVVVDEQIPQLVEVLATLLEYLVGAKIEPECITLVRAPSTSQQQWIDEMPKRFKGVRVKVHNPANRHDLAYLATTKRGKRIYLSRDIVDADQAVVLTRARYDSQAEFIGGEENIFPALSDQKTRNDFAQRKFSEHAEDLSGNARSEASEVAWLLGVPFFLQVIEGSGDDIAHIVGGPAEALAHVRRLLDESWRLQIDRHADTVVASLAGDPVQHGFSSLAEALANCIRIVQRGGRIVLLTESFPELDSGADLIRQADSPEDALAALRRQQPGDFAAAFQWAQAVDHASVYLLSRLDADVAEDLFATPLDDVHQVQKLVDQSSGCVFVPDAHKSLAMVV